VPPAGNLFLELRRSRAERSAGVEASLPAPAGLEAAVLKQRLWEKERELKLLTRSGQGQPRYTTLRADVIHLADLSPRRDAFWIWAEDLAGVRASTAVSYREALVGRVERVWTERGVGRVQTLRDPFFRVRFRYGDAWGFLVGTGRTDREGRPLLEIRHLAVEVAFREGDRVFTDGDDGYYPRGLPIGSLVRSDQEKAEAGDFLVRGEFSLDRIPEVVLFIDRAALDSRAAGKEGAE
jgi:cell shape-determining protein MreC